MDKTVFYLAKKEFMDNFRNYWIIILSIIFTFLILVISYFGSTGLGSGFRALDLTIELLKSPVILIVPIISLMLGYASIVREIEDGSMSSLLSFPVKRYEVVLGKFLGLGSVISTIILIGFLVSGVVIAINTSGSDFIYYFGFIGATILLGLGFLSVSLFFSSILKRRTTAIGAAIFLWIFFAIIWNILIIGIAFTVFMSGNNEMSIDWLPYVNLINPLMAISYFGGSGPPDLQWILVSYFSWIIMPLILTFVIFEKKDI